MKDHFNTHELVSIKDFFCAFKVKTRNEILPLILLGISVLIPFYEMNAQVQGIVRDAQSLQTLPGANIRFLPGTEGSSTDEFGRFQITAKQLESLNAIEVRFLGYETVQIPKNELELTKLVDIRLKLTTLGFSESLVVKGVRAQGIAPTTYTVLDKKAIEKINLGQDLPILLRSTPSVVSTSDAGGGVGYTGLRIRGSDPTRINVTINGIPINDAESQGVFWVNMPDIAQSVSDIEIQRGVGTSTNGAGAFGATVSLKTDDFRAESYGSITNGIGSFNTRRHTLEWGTGQVKDHWYFNGRLSQISSDGYIDRARADLQSYYLSAAYRSDKTVIKVLNFSGNEVTYQSWWGTPEARIRNDRDGMLAVITNNGYNDEQAQNLLNDGRTFNYYTYENQVDDYGQNHFQVHFSYLFSDKLSFYSGLNYTLGSGFFEEYREDESFADYGLIRNAVIDPTVEETDLIRRRWLDNSTIVGTWNLNYQQNEGTNILFGGSYQDYHGDHFGEIIWSEFATVPIRDRYYEGIGDKQDGNAYLKWISQRNEKWKLYADLQVRTIQYNISGTDNDLRTLSEDLKWTFFNPKFGFTYSLNDATSLYSSFAVANREPVRGDIIDAPADLKPRHETLYNLETGIKVDQRKMSFSANYYFMYYNDQLVVTGQLNDVGANIRQNVSESYRTGIELSLNTILNKSLQWSGNLSLSQNKIAEFSEYSYDYGADFSRFDIVKEIYTDTDIAFSPNIIANSIVQLLPTKDLQLNLVSKFVGRQYLDNTSNRSRSLDPYFVNDLQIRKSWKTSFIPELNIQLDIRNIFNHMYENNGYTFGYFVGAGNEIRENYLYPQAGRHTQLQISMKF